MGLDSLRNNVSDYVNKKSDLKDESDQLNQEIDEFESLSQSSSNLDSEIRTEIDNYRTSLADWERDLEAEEDELESVKDNIVSEIRDEQKKIQTAKSKIDSLKDSKYADKLKKASDKGNELLSELADMLETMEENSEVPEGIFPANDIVRIGTDKYRTDDNGMIHMKRDPDGQYYVLPNKTYTVNGYTYQTDDKGRIVHAGGKIRVREGGRRSLNTKVPDMGPGDQRGHIIADLLGGSNLNDNLVAQLSWVNDVPYKALEEKLAALSKDHEVIASYTIHYDDQTKRPSCITVSFTVDGRKQPPQDFVNY